MRHRPAEVELGNGQRPTRARSVRQQHTGPVHASYVASYRSPSSLRRAEQCSIVGECRRPTRTCSEQSPACAVEVHQVTEEGLTEQGFWNRPSFFLEWIGNARERDGGGVEEEGI